MKPIGNNAGGDTAAFPGGMTELKQPETAARIKSRHSARFEDIIGSAPVKSSAIRTAAPSRNDGCNHSAGLKVSETIAAAFRGVTSNEHAYAAAMAALKELFGCKFAGHFTAADGKVGQVDRVIPFHPDCKELSNCVDVCRRALQQQNAIVEITESGIVVATVVQGTPQSIVAELPGSGGSEAVSALELIAARLGQLSIAAQLHASANASLCTAALVELISLASAETTEKAAQQKLADELQKHLGAEGVFIGACPVHRPICRLVAMSDVAEIDHFSDSTRHVESVMQESIARSAASAWPTLDAANRHSLLAHQHLANEQRIAAIAATPLRSESGDVVGSVVATFAEAENATAQAESAMKFLNAASRPVGTALQAIQRSHVSPVGKWKQQLRRILSGNKAVAVGAIIGLLGAILLLPVDYQVSCDTILQPVSRRYIAAPFAAPLEACKVDPGDLVEQNQLLAVLDGRELRWELAGLRADRGKADKEHNSHLSQQKYGDAAIARHEIDRLENRSRLLSDRERNLEIRSPISGVVVSGDLREREGVPLETGQSLFEIAPLDRLVLEIAIPEEDYRHVAADMLIEMQLDSMPGETLEAVVLRIHPKAELRDHENVFIAEAEIANCDLLLRPGMKGTAYISTGRRALGWNLFHKPVAHVTGWLGW